jgi:hypothetical protein
MKSAPWYSKSKFERVSFDVSMVEAGSSLQGNLETLYRFLMLWRELP